jgi:hypothetical protein
MSLETRQIRCPACGAANEIHYNPALTSIVCGACWTRIDLSTPDGSAGPEEAHRPPAGNNTPASAGDDGPTTELIVEDSTQPLGSGGADSDNATVELTTSPYRASSSAAKDLEPTTGIPLRIGMQGTLRDDLYLVIGRVRYRENYTHWDEWLLLGPKGAGRWIADSEGLGLVLWVPFTLPDEGDLSRIDKGAVINLGQSMVRVQSRGYAVVDYIEGMINWSVSPGDLMEYAQAIGPGGIYTIRWTANEIACFHGRRPNRADVEHAFGVRGV